MGVVVSGSTPAELAATFKADIDKWGPIIKENGSASVIESDSRESNA